MNELSRVTPATAPGDFPVSKATIYAAIACAVIYTPLCIVMLAISGLTERVFVFGLGGYLLWSVVWIIGGLFIEMAEIYSARAMVTGLVYGAIVGLVSGYALASWPYCSYPTDPTPQTLVVGIAAPAVLFHSILFGIFGGKNHLALFLLSSATFWAVFGLSLAKISGLRRLKAQRRLASA
jgi:hypothetical protein